MNRKLQKLKDESHELWNSLSYDIQKTENHLQQISQDCSRVYNITSNSKKFIGDIDEEFRKCTKLNEKDITFLFAAASIQTLRWALLPRLNWDFKKVNSNERLTAADGGKREKQEVLEFLKKDGLSDAEIKKLLEHKHINNYTWQKLLIAPVPYDAMMGTDRIDISGISEKGKNLYGINHHSATFGHNQIWGWFFGPVNIITRTITFTDFQTYHVAQVSDTNIQKVTYKSSLDYAIARAIKICCEDNKKLFAAVAKQGMHLQSDKYTKLGLPIPFLSPEKAQELLLKGWNTNEVERLFTKLGKNIAIVGAQFGLATLIDNIIRAIHLLYYDEIIDGAPDLYSIKTNKIICYSNALAEIANGIYIATTADVGKADIGGYINLAKNLIINTKLQREIKMNFIKDEMYNRIIGEPCDFMKGDI